MTTRLLRVYVPLAFLLVITISVTLLSQTQVKETGSLRLFAGTNALTTSAEALAAATTIVEVLVQNDPNNTDDILVGNATSQTIQLSPGQSVTIPIDDLADVSVVAVTGTPTANYLARW